MMRYRKTGYAASPKATDTKLTWLLMSPLVVPRTCPFLSWCIASYPCIVRDAVSNDQNPIPGLTLQLRKLYRF